MELPPIFERFVAESPQTVIIRALLERGFNAEALDALYEKTATRQYTRELLFSAVFDLMSQVVFKLHPSIHAAYQKTSRGQVGVSLTSVYNKLNGIEVSTSAAL